MSSPTLSVVLPCLNEASHLESSLGRVRAVLEGVGLPFELIVVDDGSDDGTWELLTRLRATHADLRAVRLSRRFGKEQALCAGLDSARGEAVIVMDGDLQHPPHLIPDMVRAWREEGASIVEAVKSDRGRETFFSRLGAGSFYALMDRLSGFDLRGASDFKLLDRRALSAWSRMGERNVFFRGMSAWLGFPRKEIRFKVEERAGGRTNWSPLQLARLAVTGITSFSSAPIHLITLMGVLFLVFALGLSAQTLFNFFSGQAATGFTTVIILVLVTGSMMMIGLGVIGTYVSRIYEEVKARPRYVVAEELGAGDTVEDLDSGPSQAR